MAEAPQAVDAAQAARGEPWRQALVEALQRRAAAAEGPLRDELQRRAERQLQALAAHEQAPAATPATATVRPGRLALTALLRHATAQSGGAVAGATPAALAQVAPAELNALRQFRHSWSRLRLDEQLSRSLAALPDNAGPLNSERLALRSLQRLRELSPGYLAHFVAQVEALQALGRMGAGRVEAEKARKPRR